MRERDEGNMYRYKERFKDTGGAGTCIVRYHMP